MTKVIPFFGNSPENIRCLHSCIKSILAFYFPGKSFTDEDIDINTMQTDGWAWLPPFLVWLSNLGLDVRLYPTSGFLYQRLADEGEIYLRECLGENYFIQERNGAFKNLIFLQETTRKMIAKGLCDNDSISTENLESELANDNVLAVGKTVYEWLDRNQGSTGHYVVLIKKYSPGVWKVHDPGLPHKENRKIAQEFEGRCMLGDVMLVKGILN